MKQKILLYLFFGLVLSSFVYSWNNETFSHRIKINFTSSYITENTYLPVLLNLNSSNFNFSQIQSNGNDIRIIDSDDLTELPYEIDYLEYPNTLIIWFSKYLNTSDENFVYLYFGNIAAENGENKSGVWKDYVSVFHLTNFNESIDNLYYKTVYGTPLYNQTGLIGKSWELEGAYVLYNFTRKSFDYYNTAITVISKPDETSCENSYDAQISGRSLNASFSTSLWLRQESACNIFDGLQSYSPSELNVFKRASGFNATVFKVYTFLINGSDYNNMYIYKNGIRLSSSHLYQNYAYNTGYLSDIYIGFTISDIIFDEFRVHNVSRSDEYIQMESDTITQSNFINFEGIENYSPPEFMLYSNISNNTYYNWSDLSPSFLYFFSLNGSINNTLENFNCDLNFDGTLNKSYYIENLSQNNILNVSVLGVIDNYDIIINCSNSYISDSVYLYNITFNMTPPPPYFSMNINFSVSQLFQYDIIGNPRGYSSLYEFENNLLDSGIDGKDLTCAGGSNCPSYVSGKFNYSADFDINDYVYAQNSYDFDFHYDTPFSVTLWIRKLQKTSDTQNIFSKRSTIGTDTGYFFFMNNAGLLGMSLREGTNNLQRKSVLAYNFTVQYSLIAVTYDGSGSGSGLKIYVNDTQISTTLDSDTLGTSNISTSVHFQIGGYDGLNKNMVAQIDNFKVYNVELNQTEIIAIYNGYDNPKTENTTVNTTVPKYYNFSNSTLPNSLFAFMLNGTVQNTDNNMTCYTYINDTLNKTYYPVDFSMNNYLNFSVYGLENNGTVLFLCNNSEVSDNITAYIFFDTYFPREKVLNITEFKNYVLIRLNSTDTFLTRKNVSYYEVIGELNFFLLNEYVTGISNPYIYNDYENLSSLCSSPPCNMKLITETWDYLGNKKVYERYFSLYGTSNLLNSQIENLTGLVEDSNILGISINEGIEMISIMFLIAVCLLIGILYLRFFLSFAGIFMIWLSLLIGTQLTDTINPNKIFYYKAGFWLFMVLGIVFVFLGVALQIMQYMGKASANKKDLDYPDY